MINLSDLNPEQRDAVTSVKGPLLILAGAGTGKTRVISYRIAHMTSTGVPADAIVALSFTNKAAKEMAERVRALTGATVAKQLRLGTFHSFCLSMLREFPEAAGLERRFSIAPMSDQFDLVRKALEEKAWQGTYAVDILQAEISKSKNILQSPDDIRRLVTPGPSGVDPQILAEVYEVYERQLRLHRLIDFDDCIYRAVRLLRENADICKQLQERYRYLMVDEFQDTNNAQLSVLEELAGTRHNICVVGDDDQSIYSWRGAMYETLERFERMFPGTKLVKLEQNYRCSNIILDAANTVIKNNSQRKEKALWSKSKETSPIVVSALENDESEARWIAEKCMSLLGEGHQPRDIGILYRSNNLSRPIEMALKETGIASKTFGGQSFFERKEVKDFLAYLRLVIDSDDRLAFWRIINVPTRGLGLKTLEKIEELGKQNRKSPYAIIKNDAFREHFSRQKSSVEAFTALIGELAGMSLATPEDVETLGTRIIKDCGLIDDVRHNTDQGNARDRKIESLRILPAWLRKACDEMVEETGELDAYALLDRMTLSDQIPRKEEDKTGNYVSLMSIHGSKGLEFPYVFVCGVEEDILPHKNSIIESGGIAEERRLFYVALTRAKKRVHLTYTLERQHHGRSQVRHPSRFFKEIPEALMVHASELSKHEASVAHAEVRKTNTISQLSKIRENLLSGKW